MANIFNKILVKKPKHSYFDLSYDHKLSLKMGKLVPVHISEALPGDNYKMSSEAMFRMMPMIAPIMHKVDVYMHFFFVPNRILWPNWEKFIMGPEDGNTATPTPAFPVLNNTQVYNVQASDLMNYMGLPLGSIDSNNQDISAMPFAAYQRIWHEYYRDQNLQPADPIVLADGSQTIADSDELTTLRNRAWEHDYFTSALPFAQKGAAVDLPFDIANDLEVKSRTTNGEPNTWFPKIVEQGTGNLQPNVVALGSDASASMIDDINVLTAYDPQGDLYVDKDDVTASTTINDLRTAFSLQKWLEKNARAGSRYVEGLLAHFGVRSSDKRLQRPEYLGGSKANMAISEVLQTSETDTETPQGNMAGHGISVSGGKDFEYYCEEHGFIIGILSIRPKTAYYQGIPKFFSKTVDRLQYYWPDFAFLGEQEILNKEVYFDDVNPTYNEETFGYIPRYSEYRFNNSRVSGQMAGTLEFWHMGRKFASPPMLNGDFVQADPTTRVFAVDAEDSDTVVAHIYHKILAKRPLPKYGSPGSL